MVPARFTIPPVEAEVMYDLRFWARQPGREVFVNGPWMVAAAESSAKEAVPSP